MEATGWILDVYIDRQEAAVWVRTEDNRILKLRDKYVPSLYILPSSKVEAERIVSGLRCEPEIESIGWTQKYVNLDDEKKTDLLQVRLSLSKCKQLLRVLQKMERPPQLFNGDLLHVQLYLFTKLKIEPTSKVHFTYDPSSNRLLRIEKVQDDDLNMAPPPFTALTLRIFTESSMLTPDAVTDPIKRIAVRYCDEPDAHLLEGTEQEVLEALASVIREKDPDVLVAPSCDEFTFPYLFTRAKQLRLNLQFGREPVDFSRLNKPLPGWARGRVVLDYVYYGATSDDWGIAGLVERCRFAFIPPGIAGRWTANRINDSRVCFELIQRDYVIPKNMGYYESVRPVEEIFERDRGGIIISPKICEVHENVGELDYESEFPNIIVKEGISFETVTVNGMQKKTDAILPLVTRQILERRLHFKRMKKSFEKGSKEWVWCEQRQQAGKMILVCIYGTSGCCWNRYGNVLAFEEINRRSRWVMVRTKDLVQENGYEIIRAVVDSVFVKKKAGDTTKKEEYEEMAKLLSRETRLPVSLDHHFKFIMLLPLEGDPTMIMEAQNRYYGILYDGEIVCRGIEIRRHDTPPFIKAFQVRLIETLFDCESAAEVYTKGYERATVVVTEAIDKIMTGEVPNEELVVSKILRKTVSEYRSLFPHVSAAIRLISRGKTVSEGDNVQFLFTDADHVNPLCRVVALEEAGATGVKIDREKYRELLLDAAETILSPFGFSRAAYGLPVHTKSWIQEIWNEKKKERQMETETEWTGTYSG